MLVLILEAKVASILTEVFEGSGGGQIIGNLQHLSTDLSADPNS